MIEQLTGETVPNYAAITLIKRALLNDGHMPTVDDCVDILDRLAPRTAAGDRVLNFTALEFWCTADEVLYRCGNESACTGGDRIDGLTEDSDPILFNLCRLVSTCSVLIGRGPSRAGLFATMSALDLAIDALPSGALSAYLMEAGKE
ncbi:hypothetical protein [Corynebacterium accolens]|uniref:hypothetical protein n=1 Tax=Corynebacterium accolens TaxID=38284 RepID=UPI00266F0BA0|nr:hypothetical protein [Corynebacterium accolens]WKS54921.1 hypothetical protein NLL31_06730 [Corynebacterium accolens]